MKRSRKRYEIDMCNGSLFPKLIRFALPVMLSGMLQLLFNAMDTIVVGRFSGSEALAAVGSTSSLISLIINLFIGVSVGANVITARYFGAHSDKDVHEAVHTSMVIGLVSGIAVMIIGVTLARPALSLMGTPENVLDGATLYMRIYFLGMPFFTVYNFGAAVLRAVGDTKHPLYFLTTAGVINILLNLLFVIVFKMSVAGVGIATVISQIVSCALIVVCMCRNNGSYRLNLKKLKINKQKLKSIVFIGLPAGLQGTALNFSNVLIQSSVNSFGALAVAGNTAASNIDGMIYVAVNSVSQTALSFISQNFGAGNYKRIQKIFFECIGIVLAVGGALGVFSYIFGHQLLGIYSSDADVIAFGMIKVTYMCLPYAMFGIMDTIAGALRGLGEAIAPTAISLFGTCALRIVWIYTVFAYFKTPDSLFISYPVTWCITIIPLLICYIVVNKKLKNKMNMQNK